METVKADDNAKLGAPSYLWFATMINSNLVIQYIFLSVMLRLSCAIFLRQRPISDCPKICWQLDSFHIKSGNAYFLFEYYNITIPSKKRRCASPNVTCMLKIGPKGLEFARYSLDYHTIRNYLHVNRAWGKQRYPEKKIWSSIIIIIIIIIKNLPSFVCAEPKDTCHHMQRR